MRSDHEDLRELVYLLLDLRIGAAGEFHPELSAILEDLDRAGPSFEAMDIEPESGTETETETQTEFETGSK